MDRGISSRARILADSNNLLPLFFSSRRRVNTPPLSPTLKIPTLTRVPPVFLDVIRRLPHGIPRVRTFHLRPFPTKWKPLPEQPRNPTQFPWVTSKLPKRMPMPLLNLVSIRVPVNMRPTPPPPPLRVEKENQRRHRQTNSLVVKPTMKLRPIMSLRPTSTFRPHPSQPIRLQRPKNLAQRVCYQGSPRTFTSNKRGGEDLEIGACTACLTPFHSPFSPVPLASSHSTKAAASTSSGYLLPIPFSGCSYYFLLSSNSNHHRGVENKRYPGSIVGRDDTRERVDCKTALQIFFLFF